MIQGQGIPSKASENPYLWKLNRFYVPHVFSPFALRAIGSEIPRKQELPGKLD